MMKTFLAVFVVFLAGCVQLTEQQREARDYRRLDFEARYLEFRARCKARGGKIYVDASRRIGPRGIPNTSDSYSCF